jgi:plastocyanin
MTRIVCATTLYALLATLVLAAPLAASEEAQPEQTPPEQAVVEEVVPPPAEPEVAAPEVEPVPAAPEPVPAAPEPQPPPEPSQVVDTVPVEKPREKGQLEIARAAASGSVTISDFQFAPASITVEMGDTVTWTNAGPTAHSATGDSFDTGIFSEGQSRSETFNEAGTFSYICTPHPQMKGTVTVQAAAQGGDDTSSDGSDGGAATDTGSAVTDDSGTAAESSSVATLPATGLDAGGLLLLGLMTLGLGAFLRHRAVGTG